jgi:hypothetical protein
MANDRRYCMHSKTGRITIDVPMSKRKEIKTNASIMDLSIKELMLLGYEFLIHKKFNKVTEKAVKQALTGKNLKRFKNIDALLEDLEK